MSQDTPNAAPPTHGMAITAIIVAVLSYICFWGIGGFAAAVLGVAARHGIIEGSGKYRGKALATAAIALGAINVAATAAAGVAFVQWLDNRQANAPPTAAGAPSLPTSLPTASATQVLPAPRTPPSFSSSSGVWITELGDITLIDVPDEGPSLREVLSNQQRLASEDSRALLVWIVAPGCAPCNGVAAALDAPSMQTALAQTRLVRVNVRAFAAELQSLAFPVEQIPGFVLTGPNQRVIDYIHGGEWDDDVASNIAPVLEDFVAGKLESRRNPWRGGRHPDQTTL